VARRVPVANQRIVVALGVGALIVIIGLVGRLGPVLWIYDHTLVPIGSGLTSIGNSTSSDLSNIANIRNLAKENLQLTLDNEQLRQQLAGDAQAMQENTELKQQLGLDVGGSPKEVGADVVAFEPDSYRDFITLNRGTHSGIAAGMAVISQGVLIGTVQSVQSNTATVMLVTDPDFKLAAEDQNTGADGVLSGQIGGGLMMGMIGQNETVKSGDTIITSGLGGTVPAGLVIGQIESVNSGSNVVFQTAQVETSMTLTDLRFAFVVVGS
jgi:rod shape-determining protein MreC